MLTFQKLIFGRDIDKMATLKEEKIFNFEL